MYELLLVLAVLLFFALKYRETFVMKYGNPYNNEDLLSFDPKARGKRIFAITPDTCPSTDEEVAGLCYTKCEDGYHGNATICTADTIDRGVGKIPLLQPCNKDDPSRDEWYDDGLLCRAPIKCASGWEFFTKGCSGGQVEPKKMQCTYPEHTDFGGGLCYRKCPKGWRPVDGLWHLCFRGHRGLTYDRGAGRIPALWAGPE